MERKLEITKRLEELAEENALDSSTSVLNIPSANYCEKRKEIVYVDGKKQQSCYGCVTNQIAMEEGVGFDVIRKGIDFFKENKDTRFITVNGRGDPFHPILKELNLQKIEYAKELGIGTYVFTAGNNLDDRTCQILADTGTNVMISLYGNRFIDAEFFDGIEYPSKAESPYQNQARIVENLRRLIDAYKKSDNQPEEGLTRIGMNYVVSEKDLEDGGAKVAALKKAANENGIFFVCNTHFGRHDDDETQLLLEKMVDQYSDFNLKHSTFVDGRCQMGVGSSATIDYDGKILQCPYQNNSEGNIKFQDSSVKEIEKELKSHRRDGPPCKIRPYQK